MALSPDEEETLRQRVLRALANSNPAAIKLVLQKCRQEGPTPQARNALDLLEHQSKMVHSLANDVVALLDDRRRLVELMEVYEHLEQEFDDT